MQAEALTLKCTQTANSTAQFGTASPGMLKLAHGAVLGEGGNLVAGTCGCVEGWLTLGRGRTGGGTRAAADYMSQMLVDGQLSLSDRSQIKMGNHSFFNIDQGCIVQTQASESTYHCTTPHCRLRKFKLQEHGVISPFPGHPEGRIIFYCAKATLNMDQGSNIFLRSHTMINITADTTSIFLLIFSRTNVGLTLFCSRCQFPDIDEFRKLTLRFRISHGHHF